MLVYDDEVFKAEGFHLVLHVRHDRASKRVRFSRSRGGNHFRILEDLPIFFFFRNGKDVCNPRRLFQGGRSEEEGVGFVVAEFVLQLFFRIIFQPFLGRSENIERSWLSFFLETTEEVKCRYKFENCLVGTTTRLRRKYVF